MKNFISNIKLLALAVALSLLSTVALAGNHGGGSNSNYSGGYAGYVTGGASSQSSGGSMSDTSATNNGYAYSANANAGGGSAYAGGSVDHSGIDAWSGVDSFSQSGSLSFGGGNYSSSATGGNGTDVASYASGKWVTGGFGGYSGWGN